jgi:hypothetical protein
MTDQPQDLRGLKAAVGIMGVLIVVGTTVVVGTIIHRLYARVSAPPPMAMPLALPALPAVAAVPVAAQLPPGEHIAGIAAAGGDVAVWVNGPDGGRLLLLNPVSGQISLGLQETPPTQK